MQELIKLISEKTGIAEDKARQAAETALTFIKERLPGPLAAQVEAVVNGASAASKLAEAAKGLRGMFGS
jgi:hypothetical protein